MTDDEIRQQAQDSYDANPAYGTDLPIPMLQNEIRRLRKANKRAAQMATDAYNRAIDDCIKELGVLIYTDGRCLESIKALKTHNAKIAEACAKAADSWGDARQSDKGGWALHNYAEAIRSGEWRKYL